jgi:uncharacterized membrane protein HdeD (DUF308 family)
MENNHQYVAGNILPFQNKAIMAKWPWLLGIGIALVILGTFAILAAALTTLISVVFLGGFLIANGILLSYQAGKLWWGQWEKFFLQAGIGFLYVIAGIVFIANPISAAVTLTLMFAIFYIIIGISRAILAITHRISGWGWLFVSALITTAIGILILSVWPSASLWILGVFVGIDIVFIGWAFIMSALWARKKIQAVVKE